MTISLLNIWEEEIVLWDKFSTIEIDCEDNIFLRRSGSQLNPCPWANNFSLPPSTLSRLVPAWCYDGTERVSISDSNLKSSNVRLWVTIFQTNGSDPWAQYPIWNNITLPNGQLTGVVPHGVYVWKIVNIYDSDLLSSNVKLGQSILWTSWTYYGSIPDSTMIARGYHTGASHWSSQQNSTLVLTRCLAMAGKVFALYVSEYVTNMNRQSTTLIMYDGSNVTRLYHNWVNSWTNSLRQHPTANHFYLYVWWTMKYDIDAIAWTITYVWSITPTETEITTNIATMNNMTYEPVLLNTRMWWSGSEQYMWASCNFKINRL